MADLIGLAVIFLVLALVAFILGARGIAGFSMEIAKWLVIIFVILAVITFFFRWRNLFRHQFIYCTVDSKILANISSQINLKVIYLHMLSLICIPGKYGRSWVYNSSTYWAFLSQITPTCIKSECKWGQKAWLLKQIRCQHHHQYQKLLIM